MRKTIDDELATVSRERDAAKAEAEDVKARNALLRAKEAQMYEMGNSIRTLRERCERLAGQLHECREVAFGVTPLMGDPETWKEFIGRIDAALTPAPPAEPSEPITAYTHDQGIGGFGDPEPMFTDDLDILRLQNAHKAAALLASPAPPAEPSEPIRFCSAHRHAEDPTCKVCYPAAQPTDDARRAAAAARVSDEQLAALERASGDGRWVDGPPPDGTPQLLAIDVGVKFRTQQVAHVWGASAGRLYINNGVPFRILAHWSAPIPAYQPPAQEASNAL